MSKYKHASKYIKVLLTAAILLLICYPIYNTAFSNLIENVFISGVFTLKKNTALWLISMLNYVHFFVLGLCAGLVYLNRMKAAYFVATLPILLVAFYFIANHRAHAVLDKEITKLLKEIENTQNIRNEQVDYKYLKQDFCLWPSYIPTDIEVYHDLSDFLGKPIEQYDENQLEKLLLQSTQDCSDFKDIYDYESSFNTLKKQQSIILDFKIPESIKELRNELTDSDFIKRSRGFEPYCDWHQQIPNEIDIDHETLNFLGKPLENFNAKDIDILKEYTDNYCQDSEKAHVHNELFELRDFEKALEVLNSKISQAKNQLNFKEKQKPIMPLKDPD